jgi:hypothetical protein
MKGKDRNLFLLPSMLTIAADVSAYDYCAIDQLLAKNTLGQITMTSIGVILLIGATEFLGAHVLKEFLADYPGKVYCLMRPKDSSSDVARLQARLVYYFDNDYREIFGGRIFIVSGDLTELKSIQAPVDTVINWRGKRETFCGR